MVHFNNITYLKFNVAYNNVHSWVLGCSIWDSVSNLFVSNYIGKYDVLLHNNIYAPRNRVYDIDNNFIKEMTS